MNRLHLSYMNLPGNTVSDLRGQRQVSKAALISPRSLTLCQVNIGTPKNGYPGCPYSRKYRHPDAHIYVNMGTPGCPYLRGVYKTRGG